MNVSLIALGGERTLHRFSTECPQWVEADIAVIGCGHGRTRGIEADVRKRAADISHFDASILSDQSESSPARNIDRVQHWHAVHLA